MENFLRMLDAGFRVFAVIWRLGNSQPEVAWRNKRALLYGKRAGVTVWRKPKGRPRGTPRPYGWVGKLA